MNNFLKETQQLDETDKFLERCQLPKVNTKQEGNLKSLHLIKKLNSSFLNFPKRKLWEQMPSLVCHLKHLNKKNANFSQTILANATEGNLFNSLMRLPLPWHQNQRNYRKISEQYPSWIYRQKTFNKN